MATAAASRPLTSQCLVFLLHWVYFGSFVCPFISLLKVKGCRAQTLGPSPAHTAASERRATFPFPNLQALSEKRRPSKLPADLMGGGGCSWAKQWERGYSDS